MVNGEISGQDLEDILADKIIITREFNSSKAGRVFERLKQSSGGFKKMIQKFDGEFPVSHLRFRLANDMPSNFYGQTLRPENYITTIEINGKSINKISNLDTALVLSHEVIHAEI